MSINGQDKERGGYQMNAQGHGSKGSELDCTLGIIRRCHARLISLIVVGAFVLPGLCSLPSAFDIMPAADGVNTSSAMAYSPTTEADYLNIANSNLNYLYPLWNSTGHGYTGEWAKEYCPSFYSPTSWASTTTTGYQAYKSCDNATGTRWLGNTSVGSWTIYQNYSNPITFYMLRLFMNWYGCVDGSIWQLSLSYSPTGSAWTQFDLINRSMTDEDMGAPDSEVNWGAIDHYRYYPGFVTAKYLRLQVSVWPATNARFGLWEWGPYNNVVETWPSAWALGSYSVKAGHGLANATEIARSKEIIDSMTSDANWTRSGLKEPVTHSWAKGGATRHAACTYGALEGLYYATKYSDELGLSSAQLSKIHSAANASAYFSNATGKTGVQAYMWCWSILRMAFEMTGSTNLSMLTGFTDSLTTELGSFWTTTFAPDWTYKYDPVVYHRFNTPEYSMLCYGGVSNIPRMQASGLRDLTGTEETRLSGWQQNVLLRYSMSGIPNWNSDYGNVRMYVTQYMLWANRALLSMMAADDYNSGPSDQAYARYLFDRFGDWWVANDEALVPATDNTGRGLYIADPNDGVPPAQTVLVFAQSSAVKSYDVDKAVAAAMYSMQIFVALDDGLLTIAPEEPDGWVLWHKDRTEIGISTPYYHTSMITNNYWIGPTNPSTEWCGISTHKLFDSDGLPVFELGNARGLSQSFKIGDGSTTYYTISGYNGTYALNEARWNDIDLMSMPDYNTGLLPRNLDYAYVSAIADTNFTSYDVRTQYQFFENAMVMDETFFRPGTATIANGFVVKSFPLRNYSLRGIYLGLTDNTEFTVLDEDVRQTKTGLSDVAYIRIEYADGANLSLMVLDMTNGVGAQISTSLFDFSSDITKYVEQRKYAPFMNETLDIYLAKDAILNRDYRLCLLAGFLESSHYMNETMRLGRNVVFGSSDVYYHDTGTATGLSATALSGQVNVSLSVWDPGGDVLASWVADATDSTVSFHLVGLDYSVGYRVYQDGDVIATGNGPTLTFTATGGGEFMVEVWYGKQVSTLIVMTVNMVGLGIFVAVVAGWVIPFSRAIKAGTMKTNEQMMKNLMKGVVFIIIALLMWGMLQRIAIG